MVARSSDDPAAKYLNNLPTVAAPAAGQGDTSKGPIGVPKGYTVPAGSTGHEGDYGDYFRKGGHATVSQGVSGMDQLEVPTGPASHAPLYSKGAQDVIRNLSVESLARLQGQLAQVGLISKGSKFRVGVPDPTTMSAYTKLLAVANNYAISDTQALDFLKTNPQVSIKADGSVGPAADTTSTEPSTTTQTSTSTASFTGLDARTAAMSAFQSALGRDAKPKAIKALHKALNAYAAANPSVTDTTSTTDPVSGHTDSKSVQHGGIDAGGVQQIAQDAARAAPDFAETQAATQYMPALLRAIGPTV